MVDKRAVVFEHEALAMLRAEGRRLPHFERSVDARH
jgi:hypothetical protein